MAYLGRDEWDYTPRRPSPHRANRSSFLLDPNAGFGGSLYRTRSQGSQPNPVINVYNDVYQDAMQRNDSHPVPGPVPGAFPGAVPGAYPGAAYPPQVQPAVVPVPYAVDRDSSRGRRLNDELAEELRELRLERSRDRSRGRSRGHSSTSPPDFYRHQMEQYEREKSWRHERERIQAEAQVRQLKDEARRREHERDEEHERDRILAEHDKKVRDQLDREKAQEKRIRDKIEHEAKEKKEKEEEQYRKFLLKQKEEKEKKDKEAKEAKEHLEQEMRKRLAEKGFAGNQIEAIVNDEKKKGTSLTVFSSHQQPVYAKVHKNYLSVETLRFYDIPFKYDEVDEDYIIILREMDKHETNILFEHTKALRSGKLLIEAPKDKEYAFFRKRERSKSRSRGGEWKKFGIIEYKR